MAKRVTKAEAQLWGWAAIIGIPLFAAYKFIESVGWVLPILVVSGCIGLYLLHKHVQKKKRIAYLTEKYQDPDLVQKIFKGCFWQGQTPGQLIDALGNPAAVDEKILKTKKKEIWKYGHQGANRYGLRITLENDLVVGWEQKA